MSKTKDVITQYIELIESVGGVLVPRGVSLYDPAFLPQADADRLLAPLLDLPWHQHKMRMYGKVIPMPRLYQWIGLAPVIYGETITPIPWTLETLEVQERVRAVTGVLFNSLNVNYYRDGSDHIGPHSDGESEGSWAYPIASVSFGAVRDFQVIPYFGNGKSKRRFTKQYGKPVTTYHLGHGSLIVMPAGSQEFYVHKLKKGKKGNDGPRVNLTFRMMAT